MRSNHRFAVCAVVVGFLLTSARTSAQTSISIAAHWKKGDKRIVEINQTRERMRGSELQQRAAGTTTAQLEVMEASGRSYLVRWTYLDARANTSTSALPPQFDDLIAQLKGMKVDVETDKDGDFNGVRNWLDIKDFATKTIDLLLNSNAQITDAQRAQMRQLMQSVFATKRGVENVLVKEVRLYHFILGWTLTPGKRDAYDDLLPNPFGGEPFPTKASLLLKEHSSGRAVVEWKQTLEPQATRRILTKTFADIAQRVGRPAPKDDEVPQFNIDDAAEFVVDLKTGWVKSIHQRRTTTTSAMGQAIKEVRTLVITDKAL